MDSRTFPDPFPAIVGWIEAHLDDPLSVEIIAVQAGLSPFHFSRMFSARMRRSVMAHVRGRRLVTGAKRLVRDPDLRLIDLAFDCGFDSQEAFTRAFKRMFGVTPGRFRRGFAVEPLEGQFPMTTPDDTAAVVQLPDLVSCDRFTVAGPSRRFDDASKADIPQLWSKLIGALPFDGQVNSHATYGVVSGVDRDEGSFDYLAGVAIDPGATPPEGFDTIVIPDATYIVFRITLDGGPIHLQIKAAMAEIWGRLIPASGVTLTEGPDFERYDGRTPLTEPGAVVEFHVPVVAG